MASRQTKVRHLVTEAAHVQGRTLGCLAEDIGLRGQRLTEILSGSRRPKREVSDALAGALGIAPRTLWRAVKEARVDWLYEEMQVLEEA